MTNKIMNKWLEILIGLILLVGGIYVWGINFLGAGTAALEVLKGGVLWMILLIGIVLLLVGINDLKN